MKLLGRRERAAAARRRGSHFFGESDGSGSGGGIGGAVRAALGWSALDCRFAFRSWVVKDLLRLWSVSVGISFFNFGK